MKTVPRRSKALAHCIALLLAVLPAACYGGVLNVWIWTPANDQTNSVPYTLPIGAWNWDLFGAFERGIGHGDTNWSWQNATIDTNSTDNGQSAAYEPTLFESSGKWTVKATYDGNTSHGVVVTVVCPDEATYPGYPVCHVPTMVGWDTNYLWGGVFYYIYTWVAQNGNRLDAVGLWFREIEPVREDGSDCDVNPGWTWTVQPIVLDATATVQENRMNSSSAPPHAQCQDIVLLTAQLGATQTGPWSCPYQNLTVITVTVDGEQGTVTTTDNGVTDPTCDYLF
jgi:hypothetical protein